MNVEVRTLRDEGELAQAWELDRIAFNNRPDQREGWMTHVRPDEVHGVFVGPELVAIVRVIPLAQWFGGRSVPMGGIGSVAVAPEHRGKGYASLALTTTLPAMRDAGQVISTLSPATTRLYRGLGWGLGGFQGWRRVPCRSLTLLPAGSADAVRRAVRDDLTAIQACYGRVAPEVNGFVDRSEGYWAETLGRIWDERYVYVVEGDGNGHDTGDDNVIDGYAVYRHEPARIGTYRIRVDEVVARHADAAVALWRLVGTSSSQVRDVWFAGPPEDPLLLLLPEQDLSFEWEMRWMVRAVDAAGAVAARGFPPGLAGAVDLDVHDRQCEWNAGRWRFSLADGHGRLEPGGTGAVRLGASALASLWSGWASAHTLRRAGLLAGGSAADLATLDAAFAGPTPWMPDFF